MEITWYVDDGYVGKDRPQTVEVDLEELLECDSWAEAEQLIYDIVQEEFEVNVTSEIEGRSLKEAEELFKASKK